MMFVNTVGAHPSFLSAIQTHSKACGCIHTTSLLCSQRSMDFSLLLPDLLSVLHQVCLCDPLVLNIKFRFPSWIVSYTHVSCSCLFITTIDSMKERRHPWAGPSALSLVTSEKPLSWSSVAAPAIEWDCCLPHRLLRGPRYTSCV